MSHPSDSRAISTPTATHAQPTWSLPSFPNGWYCVALSTEVRTGKATPLRYLGRDLVAYRGKDGVVRILDAFCPHYGAHLGHGGKVEGNALVCPFHGWKFDGGGRCVHAPHADRTPRVGVRAHVVREQDGMVLLYHHADGAPPTYEPMRIPELFGPTHRRPIEIRETLRCHVQEIRENIVDESHFQHLHAQSAPPSLTFEQDGPRAVASTELSYLGVSVRFEATMCGPGLMAVRTIGLFDTCSVAFTTPIDERTAELRWFGCTRKSAIPLFAATVESLIVAKARREIAAEVEIWNHKTHLERPVFLAHERGISKLRRWYAQFYVAA